MSRLPIHLRLSTTREVSTLEVNSLLRRLGTLFPNVVSSRAIDPEGLNLYGWDKLNLLRDLRLRADESGRCQLHEKVTREAVVQAWPKGLLADLSVSVSSAEEFERRPSRRESSGLLLGSDAAGDTMEPTERRQP